MRIGIVVILFDGTECQENRFVLPNTVDHVLHHAFGLPHPGISLIGNLLGNLPNRSQCVEIGFSCPFSDVHIGTPFSRFRVLDNAHPGEWAALHLLSDPRSGLFLLCRANQQPQESQHLIEWGLFHGRMKAQALQRPLPEKIQHAMDEPDNLSPVLQSLSLYVKSPFRDLDDEVILQVDL